MIHFEIKKTQKISFLIGTLFIGLASADVLYDGESPYQDGSTFILNQEDQNDSYSLQFGADVANQIEFDSLLDHFKIGKNVSLGGNELVDFRIQNSSTPLTCDAGWVGRVYFDMTDSSLYICDGVSWNGTGTGGSSISQSVVGVFNDSVGGLDVNVTNWVSVPWNTETRVDSGITHSGIANSSRVYLDSVGWYEVAYNIAIDNQDNSRSTVECALWLNGTTQVPGSYTYSYSRNWIDRKQSNNTAVILETTNAGVYYEVQCKGDGTAGSATLIANGSGTTVQKLFSSSAGGSVPYVSGSGGLVGPSTTKTIIIEGSGFLPDSSVSIPGFPGTIDSYTVLSPTQIEVTVTTTSALGNYDVRVSNAGIENSLWTGNGDQWLAVQSVSGTGVAGTYTESFESGLGSWRNTSGMLAWTRDSGGTPSGSTGPTSASSGTFYVYTEASSPNFPSIDFGIETTDFAMAQSISFDYHMYGADMGTLQVQTQYNGVWTTRHTITGQQQAIQGDPYQNVTVYLSSHLVEKIRLYYTSGANYTGDCTIDNVVIVSQ